MTDRTTPDTVAALRRTLDNVARAYHECDKNRDDLAFEDCPARECREARLALIPQEEARVAEPTMGERARAATIATWVLDRPNADPDDDLAVLSRQLLRCIDRATPDQEEPLRVMGAVAHASNRDHADNDGCIVCVAARPVLARLESK